MEIAQHSTRGQEQARRATSPEGEEAAHRSLELHVDYGAQGLVGMGGEGTARGALLCTALYRACRLLLLGGGRLRPSPSRSRRTDW